ncbi:hypothetical protein RUM43_007615 [Polyplax serrata]|uniref:F-box domain-containing protein n=1 Tax=Polyplax serrata TaxID=468196 RepID=A0AAN8Q6A0_POLSC
MPTAMAQVPIPLTTLSSASSSQPPPHVGRRSPMVCPLAKLGRSSPTLDSPRYRSPSADITYRRNLLDPSVYSFVRGIPSPLEPSIFVHQVQTRGSDVNCYRNSTPPPITDVGKQPRNQKAFRNINSNIADPNFRSFTGLTNDPYIRNGSTSSNIYHSLMPSSELRHTENGSPFRPPSSLADTSKAYRQRSKCLSSCENPRGSMETSLYQQCLINQGHVQHDPVRGSPALRGTSSPPVDHSFLYQTTDLDINYKVGRSSPSLDQGYHTLVSPSSGPSTPGPWADYNLLSPTGKSKKFSISKCSSSVFDNLPDEAVIKIFSWLDSSDLCICARVCKRWKSLAWEPQLWRIIKLSGENVCGDKAVRSVLRRLCGQGTTGACPTIERVLLSDGAKITDKGLTQLSRRCTELTHLQLHGSSAVTNNAIYELATKCTNLQHLDLTGKLFFL